MSQPPPMKFWEAISAFREFEHILQTVFLSRRWAGTYGDNFLRYNDLVRAQDRRTLDGYLPIELTLEIAARCTQLKFCLSQNGELRRWTPALAAEAGAITMSAVEVHDRFGGSVIEEVHEKSSVKVRDHSR